MVSSGVVAEIGEAAFQAMHSLLPKADGPTKVVCLSCE